MEMDETKLLIKIAEMYYQENKTQSEISGALSIHRSTISRLLKKAVEEEIVTFTIHYDKAETYTLEEQLELRYGLKKALIVPMAANIGEEKRLSLLAKSAADYLHQILKDDMIVGFSWGRAMAVLVRELHDFKLHNITCVPLVGGPSGRLVGEFHVNTITYEASKAFEGRALLIDAPAIPSTIEVKKALMENDFNQMLIGYWNKLDVAVFGIGSPNLSKSSRWRNFYGEDLFRLVDESLVAGDIVSRFFDENGKHIASPLDNLLVGIDSSDLKRAHYRLCIADTMDKVEAVRAAMKGKYFNVLVISQEFAQALLGE